MSKRVLKNDVKHGVKGWFRGRHVWFGPKAGVSFEMDDEEQRALYYYWKETFWMRDITANVKKGGDGNGI
jgi:hypothetical protein